MKKKFSGLINQRAWNSLLIDENLVENSISYKNGLIKKIDKFKI